MLYTFYKLHDSRTPTKCKTLAIIPNYLDGLFEDNVYIHLIEI